VTGRVRTAVVKGVSAVLHHGGATAAFARVAGVARRYAAFPILSYHRVNDDADPFFDSLPTEVFAQQMEHVGRHYRVFTVDELADRMQRGEVPANALAITFDDGYHDNLTHAAPILARYGLPATVFLASGFIGSAEAPWYDRLAQAFKGSRREAITAPWGAVFELDTLEGRVAGLARALRHLKGVADGVRLDILDTLFARLGATESIGRKDAMLTWDDVRALVGFGFSIGAHTVSHPVLSRMPSEQAWREIAGSKAAIESACGDAPRAFAYPNGGADDYTQETVKLVRRAGFRCAVTTRFGLNTPAISPWELRRGGPWEHHLPTFALKLAWYRISPPNEDGDTTCVERL
jgi:peptidoglycan/xylan/chitin deacetylase (PgdA/CDA1 family)